MSQVTKTNDECPAGSRDVLTEILREGARQLLAVALEQEVAEYIERFSQERDTEGHRLVVRNGYLPERSLQSGVGAVEVRQPRVRDRRVDAEGQGIRFSCFSQ